MGAARCFSIKMFGVLGLNSILRKEHISIDAFVVVKYVLLTHNFSMQGVQPVASVEGSIWTLKVLVRFQLFLVVVKYVLA